MVASSRSPIPALFLMLILAVLLLMFFSAAWPSLVLATQSVELSSSHAVLRHGNSAYAVRNCLTDKGAMQTWFNPTTGRTAKICAVGDAQFGIQILENVNGTMKEVTAFIKDKMSRIEQVTNYLRNAGYYPLQ